MDCPARAAGLAAAAIIGPDYGVTVPREIVDFVRTKAGW